MHLYRPFLSLVAAATAAFCIAPAPTVDAKPPTPSPCQTGWSVGDWTLPSGLGSGYAVGKFVENSLGKTVYVWEAKLIPTPFLPCFDCVEGTIVGELHDGGGVAQFTTKGGYSGKASTGQGTFWAYIYSPWQKTPVGKLSGVYSQPPWGPVIGDYKLEWGICP